MCDTRGFLFISLLYERSDCMASGLRMAALEFLVLGSEPNLA
jgi:hypothetical protein